MTAGDLSSTICNALYALRCPNFHTQSAADFFVAQLAEAGFEIVRAGSVTEGTRDES